MDQNLTECQSPEGPILYIKNCGFCGIASTMNMCSKCHRLCNEAKFAAFSIDSIVNGCCSSNICQEARAIVFIVEGIAIALVEAETIPEQPSDASVTSEDGEAKVKEGPNSCNVCL